MISNGRIYFAKPGRNAKRKTVWRYWGMIFSDRKATGNTIGMSKRAMIFNEYPSLPFLGSRPVWGPWRLVPISLQLYNQVPQFATAYSAFGYNNTLPKYHTATVFHRSMKTLHPRNPCNLKTSMQYAN